MADATELNRLFWHSRRGMLELDVLLVPFVKEVYPSLDAEDQARYRKLLECEDQDMFGWFMQRGEPEDHEQHSHPHGLTGDAGPDRSCDAQDGRAQVRGHSSDDIRFGHFCLHLHMSFAASSRLARSGAPR